MSMFTVFLGKSHIFNGQARVGKILQLGGTAPMPPGFVAGLALPVYSSHLLQFFSSYRKGIKEVNPCQGISRSILRTITLLDPSMSQ